MDKVIPWSEIPKHIKSIAYRNLPRNDPAIDIDDLIQDAIIDLQREEMRRRGNPDGWSGPLSHMKMSAEWSMKHSTRRTSVRRHDSKTPKRHDGGASLDKIPDEYHPMAQINLEDFVIAKQTLLYALRFVLTPEQAKVIWPELKGYSIDEIANALYASYYMVNSRINRGRKKIRDAIASGQL